MKIVLKKAITGTCLLGIVLFAPAGCEPEDGNASHLLEACQQRSDQFEQDLSQCRADAARCDDGARRCVADTLQTCTDGVWIDQQVCLEAGCGSWPEGLGCLEPACQPDCEERNCGPDPVCGTSCGSCPQGQECTPEGVCREQPQPGIRERLLAIEGLDIEQLRTELPGQQAFAIKMRQPLDHRDPDKGTFKQRLVLLHRSARAPVTLLTTGYGLFVPPQDWANYQDEVTLLTGANLIILEHRYFEESFPPHDDPAELDWEYLNIYQAASDSHAIVQTLSAVYPGPWIATGGSKGGMTALFHSRFYPGDLAGVVPFVAPISFGTADPRYEVFFESIGPADGVCRDQLEDLAVDVVQRRDELADLLADSWPVASTYRPEVIAADIARNASGLVWSAWQYQGSPSLCANLPQPGCHATELFPWVQFNPAYLAGSSDPYQSYGYQVYTELGGPGVFHDYLDALYAQIDFSILPQPAPPGWVAIPPVFDPDAMLEVDSYLRQEARSVVAIYGEWDPWTAAMIEVDETKGSRVFVAPAVGHMAGISDLQPDDRDEAIALIEAMVPDPPAVRPSALGPDQRELLLNEMRTQRFWYNQILAEQERLHRFVP